MAEEDPLDLNRFQRRTGFGRGVTPAIRNVPGDVQYRWTFDPRDMQRYIRDIRGRFIERGVAAQALAESHRQMAISAGEFMTRAFDTAQRGVGRPQNRKHYFKQAIRDPGNRIATPTGWGIGLPEHYDRSLARRYWRFIEFGGENPMEKVVAKGAIAARFWNPYRSAPDQGKFRDHGRMAWKYLRDVIPPEGRSKKDRSGGTAAHLALQHPGALGGAPPKEDRGKYAKREYNIIGRGKDRHVTLYFRVFEGSALVSGFRPFEGYDFHALGAQRFLAARTPSEVYRRVFAQYGIEADIT
jgi:hypothetical protein